MQQGQLQLGADHVLVESYPGIGRPAEPEHSYQRERGHVARVGQVARQCRGVLFVVDRHPAADAAHHAEDVHVVVDDGDDAGPQHEDGQRDGVGRHVAPVQHADEGVVVEQRLSEAQQRRAAQHGGGHPREHHPALAASARLHLQEDTSVIASS